MNTNNFSTIVVSVPRVDRARNLKRVSVFFVLVNAMDL